tara:strand:- start:11266 stop:12255 length:990 start_codon:yes stop_codon:yes gene_type:complete
MKITNYNIREIDFHEWRELWLKCDNQNILQSWFYGQAKKLSDNLGTVYFVISDSDTPVSIAQVLIKSLPFNLGLARINRAPLLLDEYDKDFKKDIIISSLRLVINECKRRHWIMLQIAPEYEENESFDNRLKALGLKKLSNPPWASGIIDLKQDEESILASLNGKWRNCLRKGWKLGTKSKLTNNNSKELESLIEEYSKLQKEKSFIGLSSNLIQEMSAIQDEYWKFNIFVSPSASNSTIQGTLVSVQYGKSAIYLIGSSTQEGRKNQCNYVLLWEAIQHAKKSGCIYFDIGGLDETTPKGIAHFKKGLKALPYKISGEWRGFFLPKIF